MQWSQNDKLFFSELKSGHAWQQLPAVYLALHGNDVKIPDLQIRNNINEADNWLDSIDLIVNDKIKLEIKSRNEYFTSARDFRYPTIFIDTVSGYESKKEKPFAYIMVSRETGSMLWLPTSPKKDWLIENKFDRVRQINEQFYVTYRDEWQNMNSLIRQSGFKYNGRQIP